MAQEEIEGRILENAREAYDLLEQALSPETMRAVERQVMLRVVDANWVQHLTAMENLRQGIGLHAYGQRDPLVMYKTEGHAKFQDLQTGIQHDIVHTIYHIGVSPSGNDKSRSGGRGKPPNGGASVMTRVMGNRSREPATSGGRKVGRNEQCPCGSGKKYKRCHGA